MRVSSFLSQFLPSLQQPSTSSCLTQLFHVLVKAFAGDEAPFPNKAIHARHRAEFARCCCPTASKQAKKLSWAPATRLWKGSGVEERERAARACLYTTILTMCGREGPIGKGDVRAYPIGGWLPKEGRLRAAAVRSHRCCRRRRPAWDNHRQQRLATFSPPRARVCLLLRDGQFKSRKTSCDFALAHTPPASHCLYKCTGAAQLRTKSEPTILCCPCYI